MSWFKREPEIPNKWNDGDVVRLKSGGPKMVVYYLLNRLGCKWFDGSRVRHDYFDEDLLEKIDAAFAEQAGEGSIPHVD
jgi:uncharacterized protein YodC (DUF2158 family)